MRVVRVKVPVAFLHEDVCPGLKTGGVLNVVRREIEVLADPDAVPEKFEIDLIEAKIGDSSLVRREGHGRHQARHRGP